MLSAPFKVLYIVSKVIKQYGRKEETVMGDIKIVDSKKIEAAKMVDKLFKYWYGLK